MQPHDFEERPSKLRQSTKRALEALLPRRAFMVRGPQDAREVCITFDDGPHPVHTPRVLDALARHDVRATFFVVGECAARHPELVRRMVNEGHVVGHHSYHHKPPHETSATALHREVTRSLRVLEPLIGKVPRLFRPPHGKLTAGKLAALWSLSQTVVLWSVDPRDYASTHKDEVTRHFDERPIEAGDIVLLHDSFPLAAEALGDLANRIRDRDYELVTVDAWT